MHALPLKSESIQCVVTSPPYWGLRAYAGEQSFVWGGEEHEHEWAGLEGGEGYTGRRRWQHGASRDDEPQLWQQSTPQGAQCGCGAWYGALGLEPTPELYVEHMVAIFREVRRVLRRDGTLWLNLGDSYAGSWGAQGRDGQMAGRSVVSARQIGEHPRFASRTGARGLGGGLKPKDLVGIPWRVAFALQVDGWYLRSDIVWSKPNPMPESVRDRPTKSHEYVFLLSKSERYFYDADAIREPVQASSIARISQNGGNPTFDGARARRENGHINGRDTLRPDQLVPEAGRNRRSVWEIATQPYPGSHFATYPEALVEPCIKAGSAAQACAVCGAPWERVTEFVSPKEAFRNSGRYVAQGKVPSNDNHDGGRPRAQVRGATTGWRPTCEHEDGSGQSIVLDPFNGSGTTGRVALRLGRSYVGFDLSAEYLTEQAIRRIDPLAAAAQDARTGKSEQMVMFQ
ncbi:MAG: site-specific DNA-methyltransferase [Gemmatimonadaceae bacterium]|nr:site-specific DNA-methyltransferase [Gemmatimonadaceae bacterium]